MSGSTNARDHLKHEILVGGISNTIFNGLIAWLLLKSGPALAWGGEHSFVVDVMAGLLVIPMVLLALRKQAPGE